MRIIIACGGTGGHLFPGLAVAETLLERGHEVKLLVSERTVEQAVLSMLPRGAASQRLSTHSIGAVGWNGSARALPFVYRLAQATAACGKVYHEFQPHVVVGMGGYTAAPAVLAARCLRPHRTATLIHESNAIPGKANRLAGRFVHQVAVGLADCGKFFDGKPVTVTGTPIRAALRAGKCADARARLGLRADQPTVLVMGGSQGAHAINEGIACALPWLEGRQEQVQFVHLSGAREEGFVREVYEKNGYAARVLGFCHEMSVAYSAADLVIARAGAATLAEIAAFELPSILVPYPHATGNHQWHNAQVFRTAGAARVFCQRELESNTHAERGERLAVAISELLDQRQQRQTMSAAARALARADATERIADLVEGCAERHAARAGGAAAVGAVSNRESSGARPVAVKNRSHGNSQRRRSRFHDPSTSLGHGAAHPNSLPPGARLPVRGTTAEEGA